MRLLHGLILGSAVVLIGGTYGFLAGRHHAPAPLEQTGGGKALSQSVIVSAGQFVVPVEDDDGKLDALLLAEINLALPPNSNAGQTLALTRPFLRNALLDGLFELSAKGLFTEGSVSPKDLGLRLKQHLDAVYQDEVPINAVLFDRLLLQNTSSGPL